MPRYFSLISTCCTILCLSCLVSAPVRGEEFELAEHPLVTSISSVPQSEPSPPLKYLLIPEYAALEADNAATHYYRAILLMPREAEKRFGEKQGEWLDQPLKEFPKDLARQWLVPYTNALKEIETATYCDQCDWGLRVRQLTGTEAFSFLLPELQEVRELARALRVRSCLEIAEGRFEDAQRTLTAGYRLATNLSGSPILITDLVAGAIGGIMNESVIDWIDAGGPNLYWGLASLPRPLIDIRTALQQEMNLPLQVFPFLKDPESVSYTPDQWRQVIGESLQQMVAVTNQKGPISSILAQTEATALILAGYSGAKQALIDSGMDAKRVEAMPVGQVVAVQTARVYREVFDESLKWTFLPYAQSYRQMAESFRQMRVEGHFSSPSRTPGAFPIAAMFLPALESAALAPVRIDRDIAALQTIEAIRRGAADTAGKLPASLAELQQCPTPSDPITGEPFIYKVEQGKAVLVLPPPEGRSAAGFGKRYEISLSADR